MFHIMFHIMFHMWDMTCFISGKVFEMEWDMNGHVSDMFHILFQTCFISHSISKTFQVLTQITNFNFKSAKITLKIPLSNPQSLVSHDPQLHA